ncbi:MAG: spermidine/putrescine ABC transporter substrate-binding protein [Eubacteriales bacterium]|nr:spermidine/putrescine ABC transporter substrate-binding protein [Eubacteriales bacterium]
MKKLALVLSIVMVLGLIPLAGCSQGGANTVLNVYNWGEYIDPTVLTDFEKETGIKVNYSLFDSNEIMYSKLQGGGSNYDVIFPSDYMIERLIKQNMLEELNYDNIPNASNLDPLYLNESYDPGNKYSLPYMWGTVGIVYNKTMVDDPVTSWDILWNEKYAKKIMMYDSSRDSIGVAMLKNGFSMNSRDTTELAAAEQSLIDQKPLLLSYSLDDSVDKMLAGEAAMCVVYSGQALMILGDEAKGADFGYCIPEEGSNVWYDGVCIPKGAKNKEAAEKFIDYLCRPEVALRNVEEICYSTPNSGAYALLDDATKENPAAYPDAQTLARCEVYADLGDFVGTYEDAWTRIKAQ